MTQVDEATKKRRLKKGTDGDMKRFQVLAPFVINHPDGALYLWRLRIVQTPWFCVYLHKIATYDKDRDPHNHPFPFVSIILRGGYEEVLYEPSRCPSNPAPREVCTKRRGWLSFGFRRASAIHRIKQLHRSPTWTLVFGGPRQAKSWGFFTPEGYKSWREYLGIGS